MGYYDLNHNERGEIAEKRGFDWDLISCLEYNSQGYDLLDIEKVLAVWEGENDEEDWRWILRLTSKKGKELGGRFVFLRGGCDYTGWDCQSHAESVFIKSTSKAVRCSLDGYGDNKIQVYESLLEQIKKLNKKKTWREIKKGELGSLPEVKL